MEVGINLRYEKLPVTCFLCGIIGHMEEQCVHFKEKNADDSTKPYGHWFQKDVLGDNRRSQGKRFSLEGNGVSEGVTEDGTIIRDIEILDLNVVADKDVLREDVGPSLPAQVYNIQMEEGMMLFSFDLNAMPAVYGDNGQIYVASASREAQEDETEGRKMWRNPVHRRKLTRVNPTESNELFKLELQGAWEPPVNSCASLPNYWRFTRFYGYPATCDQFKSWRLLKLLVHNDSIPWLCIGDFNEILQVHEQEGGNIRQDRQMEGFQHAVKQCRLVDLGFAGNKFTWFTTRGGGIKVRKKIKMTGMKLTNWAQNNAWVGPNEIREVEDKLTSLLGQLFTNEFIKQKNELIRQLSRLLEQEAQFWRQRSKENWVKLGDHNTKYFHQKANKRQKRNYLLMDDNACWREDRRGMEEIVVSSFTQLFRSSEVQNFDDLLCHISPKMHPIKVLGLDDMSLGFYQKHRGVVISLAQSAFVPGCLISDNYLVAIEVAHYMHKRSSGFNGVMALKLNMSKACDWVEWKFLEAMMQRLGFAERWIHMVMLCVSTVTYSFKLNGDPVGYVHPEKGIKQGDPLFPFLLVLCAEGTIGECQVIKLVLWRYELAFGQAVNFQKNCVSFNPNLNIYDRQLLANSLGMRKVDFHDKYLGLPVLVRKLKKETFAYVKDRVWKKLHKVGEAAYLVVRVVNYW
ncbi:hypothetical protein ACFX2I_032224 [Malus domestica]